MSHSLLKAVGNNLSHLIEEPFDFHSRCVITALEYHSLLKHLRDNLYSHHIIFGAVYVIFTTIGIVFNLINIAVFTRPSMKSPLNILLCCYEANNVIVFVTFLPDIITYFHPRGEPLQLNWLLFLKYAICVTAASVTLSHWLAVLVSVFRLTAVAFPVYAYSFCTKIHAVYALVIVTLWSVIIFVVFTFLNEIVKYRVIIVDGTNSSNQSEAVIYNLRSVSWMYPTGPLLVLSSTTLPCLLIVIVTVLTLGSLWNARNIREGLSRPTTSSDERELTVTLLTVLILSVLAYTPDSIVNFVLLTKCQRFINGSFIVPLADSRLGILIFNCSTFPMYLRMSTRFRTTFIELVKSTQPELLRKLSKTMLKGSITSSGRSKTYCSTIDLNYI